MTQLIDVALPIPVDQLFTYAIDSDSIPEPGTRLLVPFRGGERVGWMVGPATQHEIPDGVRPVLDVFEQRPSVTAQLLSLCHWIADYYVAPLGIALRAAVPSVLVDRATDAVTLVGPAPKNLARGEARLVELLTGRKGPQRIAALKRALGGPGGPGGLR
ncbi:MAG: hypothetical protein HY701_09215, partial [Gemmatimonadetes bacterium]|nr:hypothetical protein [Gemmatimonadota bacterium]